MDIMIGILEQGMIYAILALGVYITYRILDFPDLTVDGSFPLGAAVTVMMMTRTNVGNPLLIMFAAFVAGGVAGLVTGVIHVKFQVRDLLSGIITMTGLYSINLHIAGKANVPIFDMNSIFSNSLVNALFPPFLEKYKVLIIISLVTIGAKILMDLYLETRSGYLLRAVGNNPVVVTSLAKDSGLVKIVGLVIANGLVALAGSVMAQQQGYFEITMGVGAVVIGLATVIIGTNLFKKVTFVKATSAVIIGSLIYKLCISLAMDVSFGVIVAVVVGVLCMVYLEKEMTLKIIISILAALGSYVAVRFLVPYDISASDMKLITAVFFLLILIVGQDKKRGGSTC